MPVPQAWFVPPLCPTAATAGHVCARRACITRVRTHMGSPRPGPCLPWYHPRLYYLVAEGRVAANLAGVHAASNASQGRAFGLPTYPCVLAHAPRLGLLPA